MLKVFVDGSSRPNPGPSTVGIVVRDGDRDLHQASQSIGHASNNVAEYRAALLGLTWLHDNGYDQTPVELLSDSTTVVNGLSGYGGSNQKLAEEGRALLSGLRCTIRWIPGDDNPAHEFASGPRPGKGKSRRRRPSSQPPVDSARMERARGLAVARLGPDLFEVASSTGGKTYMVEFLGRKKGWRCECPDATYRHVKCKHAYAAEFLKQGLDQPRLEIEEIEPDEPYTDICDYEPFRHRGIFQEGPRGEYVNFRLLMQSLTPDDEAAIKTRLRQNYASLDEVRRHGLDYHYFVRDVEQVAPSDYELARLLDAYAQAELLWSKMPSDLPYGYDIDNDEQAVFLRYAALLRDPTIATEHPTKSKPATRGQVPPDLTVIHSKIAGVAQEGRQEVVASLKEGEYLCMVREPDNPYDSNAIRLDTKSGQSVGYLNRQLSARLADLLDRLGNDAWTVRVEAVTGGTADKPTRGVNIELKARG